jgi:hypothetical protein
MTSGGPSLSSIQAERAVSTTRAPMDPFSSCQPKATGPKAVPLVEGAGQTEGSDLRRPRADLVKGG